MLGTSMRHVPCEQRRAFSMRCKVVQNGAPPFAGPLMTERVRFTIAVDPEVYEAFADLAHTSGVSLSRCIGDWLRDTAEAAQMTTLKVQAVRKSPQDAFQAFIRDGFPLAELERVTASMWGVGTGRTRSARPAPAPAEPATSPPSSNTGGKSPGKTRRST